jgi:formate/nitrite transporter FocA (FNT family)
METIVATILLGFIGFMVGGLVFFGLVHLWFWMDEKDRRDR